MPLWLIHHSPKILTDEDKHTLAQGITDLYTAAGLPAFYVRIHFHEMPMSDTFIGGKPHPKSVDLTIYHLARVMTTDEQKKRFLDAVDAILNPVFEPKGIDWEYFVQELPRDLWKINGLVPPEARSEGEKEWVRLGRAAKF
ncbi:putative oxalocrotonate tautomerase [Aspergillus leporis]|jgi:phenylpyruvate tautomerase PptA (4-oxalocrotonate tautomerase family)|uniref:Putative oxalocrotonate tautomerase n=1 Tax=Aspergillus leporis TaxID=41062 RepID=A0A5N5WWU7_9EURO|nr:putative oxalocrotonate tautomerase [Aspergillus leporis]